MPKVYDITAVIAAIRSYAALHEDERVDRYNAIQCALGDMVRDFAPDPAVSPRLLAAELVEANDYNPNGVAKVELDLLEQSMRADGITMPVVVVASGTRATIVDGFHRRAVAATRLGRRYIPCSVIDKPIGERMASTVRHNRARGKHGVELMGALVRGMVEIGWDDAKIAASLGMSAEELLRLKQMVGAAQMLAAPEYGRAWGGRDGTDPPQS